MSESKDSKPHRAHVFIYRGNLPPAVGLLLAAPALLLAFSLAAALFVGAGVAALLLPTIFRNRRLPQTDPDCITLKPDQYQHVESNPPQLPRQ